MAIDLISFIVGVAAGILTGSLAGVLYSLERTADLQEQVRKIKREIGEMRNLSQDTQPKLDDLDRDLEEIHEEIRRMYKKTTR